METITSQTGASELSSTPIVYSSINAIMKEIGAIKKEQKNSAQGFMFRGVDQFMNTLHPLMAKHGIFLLPTIQHVDYAAVATKNGASMNRASMLVAFKLSALDGSFVECTTAGEAMDSGDKATNKAMAAALKYALMYVFMIATEDMEDADASSPEGVIQPPTAKTALPIHKPATIGISVFEVTKEMEALGKDIVDEVLAHKTPQSLTTYWNENKDLHLTPGFKDFIAAYGKYLRK